MIFRNIQRNKTETFFRFAQIGGAAAMSFMHGAQDGQKFMGVILLSLLLVNGQSAENVSVEMPIWLMALCSIVMGVGTSIGGKKIIKSVGMDMVKLEKYQGFSADMGGAIALFLSTAYGYPVSTTHAKTTAMMGAGASRNKRSVNPIVIKDIVMTWVLTFPGCGFLGFVVTKIFLKIL